jgi:serine phosphatase RsbU (regulator of sigma subunit)
MGVLIINESTGIRSLSDPNMAPIGLTRSVEFPRKTAQLATGEMMVLYSPGCRTLLNAKSQPVGENRLRECFTESLGLSPANVLAELQGELADVFKRGSQPDDITIIVLQRG